MSQKGMQKPGDLVVVVGGKTGRDGIHGVTFASGELDKESETLSSQLRADRQRHRGKESPGRHHHRRATSVCTAASPTAAAGGLSSAVGEMAEETGVRVDLEKVPLKYAGLSYTEIWVSESQERMLLAVPPDKAGTAAGDFPAKKTWKPPSSASSPITTGSSFIITATWCATSTWSSCTTACPSWSAKRVWQPPHQPRAGLSPAARPERRPEEDTGLLERLQQGMGHPPVRP